MSTYSSNLKIELIGTGEQAGTWGVTTDDNFSNVFEQSIVGRVTVPFTDADVTLTATNSVSSQSFRNVYLNCTGTNTASKNLIVPTINKNYVVQNNTTGGFNIVVKTTAGTGITVPNGKTCTVYADGTNVIQAFDYLPVATVGTLTITSITAGSITDSGLTSGRVTYAGTAGLLQDSANLTFNGTTLTSTGFAGPISGVVTSTSITDSGLTSGRVTYATTGGLLTDSANLTFNGTTLTTANDASISGLTVGKGGGASGNNTVLGTTAFGNNTSGVGNVAVGTVALFNNTTASNNSAVGYYALVTNTTGASNTALGSNALYANTTASNNTAVGYQAGYSVTSGGDNAAFGYSALYATTTGVNNTAVGTYALTSNTSGSYNTAIGLQALNSNTTASYSTAVGYQAGYTNTTGVITAIGSQSLYFNTTGLYNVGVGGGDAGGYSALSRNTTGSLNVAVGPGSLGNNTTASNNTAVGYQAGYSNTTGTFNTFIGSRGAGYGNTIGNQNTFIGDYAGRENTTGSQNTLIGQGSGRFITTGSSNTVIGIYDGNQNGLDIRTASNYIVLSDGAGAWKAYSNATNWYQNNNSTLWSITSDERIKKNIAPLGNGLSVILALQPKEFDYIVTNQHDIGFIAQEYEKVLPLQITEQDASGQYAELTNGDKVKGIQQNLVPYLVKAMQELNAKIEAQAVEIATLKGK